MPFFAFWHNLSHLPDVGISPLKRFAHDHGAQLGVKSQTSVSLCWCKSDLPSHVGKAVCSDSLFSGIQRTAFLLFLYVPSSVVGKLFVMACLTQKSWDLLYAHETLVLIMQRNNSVENLGKFGMTIVFTPSGCFLGVTPWWTNQQNNIVKNVPLAAPGYFYISWTILKFPPLEKAPLNADEEPAG